MTKNSKHIEDIIHALPPEMRNQLLKGSDLEAVEDYLRAVLASFRTDGADE